MSRNILFILEGSRVEPRFLRKIITLTLLTAVTSSLITILICIRY